jgi:hypothetical protein
MQDYIHNLYFRYVQGAQLVSLTDDTNLLNTRKDTFYL